MFFCRHTVVCLFVCLLHSFVCSIASQHMLNQATTVHYSYGIREFFILLSALCRSAGPGSPSKLLLPADDATARGHLRSHRSDNSSDTDSVDDFGDSRSVTDSASDTDDSLDTTSSWVHEGSSSKARPQDPVGDGAEGCAFDSEPVRAAKAERRATRRCAHRSPCW